MARLGLRRLWMCKYYMYVSEYCILEWDFWVKSDNHVSVYRVEWLSRLYNVPLANANGSRQRIEYKYILSKYENTQATYSYGGFWVIVGVFQNNNGPVSSIYELCTWFTNSLSSSAKCIFFV